MSLYEHVSPLWRIVVQPTPRGNQRPGTETTKEIVNPRSSVLDGVPEISLVLYSRNQPPIDNTTISMQTEEPFVTYKKVAIASPTAYCRGLLQTDKLAQAITEVEGLSAQTTQGQCDPRELSYLKAWIACLQERWLEATQLLDPLLNGLTMEPVGVSQTERERIARCWFSLGRIALAFTFPYEAEAHLTRCLNGIKRHRLHMPLLRTEAHILFGKALVERSQYQWAFEHFFRAERVCVTNQYLHLLPIIWVGQAWIHRHTSDRVHALATIQKTLDWAETRRDRVPLVDVSVLLSGLYDSDESFQTACASYMRVYTTWEQLLPVTEKAQIAISLLHLSLQQGDRTYIPTFLAQLPQWLEEVQEPVVRAMLLGAWGTIHATEAPDDDLDRYKERILAIRLLKQALHELVETQAVFLMRTYCMQVSAIYEDVKHLPEALFYAKMGANF